MDHIFAHSQQKPHNSTWFEYRRNRRNLWLTYLALPFAELISYGLFDSLFGDAVAKTAMFVTFALCGFAIQIYESRLRMFCCPRCKKRFFKSHYRYNSFARRCLNCGLPKYA